ncbi:DUF637 domain-containing protein, partial [Pseudomonas syringae]|uniref:DUF637 domain-containing protein n=1 Tax=Pseudomonas syringae TaxID=317 RepID=UPI00233F99C6
DNVGTLRAANNLSAAAGNDLVNSGLIEAGNRLDLLAGNDLINKSGGIIAGRDVTLTALRGDVINERTVTSHQSASGDATWRQDFADSAARIEAANDMSLQAGRDVKNTGSVLQAGRDLSIAAGRDVAIDSAQTENGQTRGANSSNSSITQLGSMVSAGRDLTAQAGRDINVIASSIDAKRDIAMAATENLTLSSAADEQHSYGKSKKVTEQEDHVSQVSADLKAGGSVALQAGQNLAVISSRITAGKEAYLVAGENLDILAAQDSDYSLYDMKKKGSFGAKKTQRDEVTDVKNIGSEITTGGDLVLSSGGDQKYQAAKLESGKDLTIESSGAVTFEGVKDLHQESHEKSDNNAFWVSSKGKGNTDETLRQSELVAAGEVTIRAVNGLQIDIKQVDQQTVTQSIDAMVKADPQLAWLKDAEKRGDVDWRQVKEIHDSFKYSNSGLGPASQIIIAVIMAAVVGPMAMGAVGASTGAAVTAGTMGANTAAFLSAGAGAVAAGAATNATVSVINNRGNLGAVFKDVTSSDAMKGYAISGVTAGLTAAYFDGLTGTHTDPNTGKIVGAKLSTWEGVGQFAGNQVLQNGTSTLLSNALGKGGSGSDALKTALFNTLAAASFNAVGDYTYGKFTEGMPPKVIIHAMVGGLLSKATGGDFRTGALAAGANEALVVSLESLVQNDKTLLPMASQIVGVLAAASSDDANADSIEKAAWITKNATMYNRQSHEDEEMAKRDEVKKGGLTKENLDKASCYVIKCWAQYDRASSEYRDSMIKESDVAGLGNELMWVEAQQEKGLFNYRYIDAAKDLATRDVIPLGTETGSIVTGGISVASGYTLCGSGVGCVFGAPMAAFGAGNVVEGGTGIYNHFYGGGEGYNPVKEAFSLLPGNLGGVAYSSADFALSLGAGLVKVPLKMGLADGLNRPKSMFGVMVSGVDNNFFLPAIGATPYGTAMGMYFYSLAGKGNSIYKEVSDEKK